MSTFLLVVYALLAVFGTVYCLLILLYTYGWFRLKTFVPRQDTSSGVKISVIIPARNEADNICNILEDLNKQSMPSASFEVLVVDDHSEDGTADNVMKFGKEQPDLDLKLIRMEDAPLNTPYKKNAIRNAIGQSNGTLIVTTDADCRVGSMWLETIAQFYKRAQPKMIVSPVSFHNEQSFFEKLQTGEFLSLIAVTGGAIRINKPLMCNGANLAYEKSAFEQAGGFGSDTFSSGDDVFLMARIRKLFGNRSIRFLKSNEALVFTQAKARLSEFMHQRTRWASKNKGYEFNILFVSFTVYMVNLLLLLGIAGFVAQPESWPYITFALLIKILVDVPILIGIGIFVNRPRILLYVLPLVFIYPVYVALVGALGVLGNYQWKGRRIKK